MVLNRNSQLQGGKYVIEEVLGQGGFGITYLGVQTSLGRKVAIKEFFMKEICNRDETTSHVSAASEGSRELLNRFREKFVKEARSISLLEHPNIVSVIDIFEENDTAYYVMNYLPCGSLASLLKDKYPTGMHEQLALKYIRQVASALEYIHKRSINHLDVKPGNIMLTDDDNVQLIDFGLAKQYDIQTGEQTSSTPVGISEGYAPVEQYKKGGVSHFSPETDIYALGATLYKLLTGKTPPSASDVYEDGLPYEELKSKGVSSQTIDLITKAMQGRRKDRIQSARTFIDSIPTFDSVSEETVLSEEMRSLTGANSQARVNPETPGFETPTVPPNQVYFNDVTTSPKKTTHKSSFMKWILILGGGFGIVGVIILILGIIFFSLYNSSPTCDTCGLEISECEYNGVHPSASELYEKGADLFFDEDYVNAVQWFQKAADQGEYRAQNNLAYCYEHGLGVSKDLSQAAHWYLQAAEQGHSVAQFNIGLCYKNGTGVAQDLPQAAYWFRKAADQGDPDAQFSLGVCYDYGEGVDLDHSQAAYWYYKAADQGLASAQYNLGVCYEYGEGLSIDRNKAIFWYQKAADQGNESAKKHLKALGR